MLDPINATLRIAIARWLKRGPGHFVAPPSDLVVCRKRTKGSTPIWISLPFLRKRKPRGFLILIYSNSTDGTCVGVGVIGASFSIMSSCLVHDFRAVPRLLPGCSLHVVVVWTFTVICGASSASFDQVPGARDHSIERTWKGSFLFFEGLFFYMCLIHGWTMFNGLTCVFVLLNQLPLQGVDWWALGVLLFEMMAGLDNTSTLDNSKSRT